MKMKKKSGEYFQPGTRRAIKRGGGSSGGSAKTTKSRPSRKRKSGY